MMRILVVLLCCMGVALSQGETEKKKPADPKAVAKKADKAESKPAKSKEKPPQWLAVLGGTVWTVSGDPIPEGVVLVKDAKIYAVGKRGALKVPEGATVVDASGRHVAPGFVCAAARGALGSRGHSAKEKAADRFNPFSDTMLMCLAAGITTAHEGPGGRSGFGFAIPGRRGGGMGGIFSGTPTGSLGGVIGKLTYGTVEGFEVRDPAGVFMTFNPAASKREQTEKALKAAYEYRKKRRAWLEDLVAKKKDAKEPKGSDTTKALARCLDGELPLYIGAESRKAIQGCLELSDLYRVPMVLHGVREGWTMAPEIGRRPVTVLLSHRTDSRAIRPFRDPNRTQPHGWSITNAATLSQAGVVWGTVAPSQGVITGLFAGRDLTAMTMEACFAVRGGATEKEALASITLTAARILGIDDRVGSLAPGKDADLLVLDREPLDYRAMVDLVYVNGRLAYDRSKVSLWNHIRTDRSKGMGPWKPWGPWPELRDARPPDAGGGNGGN